METPRTLNIYGVWRAGHLLLFRNVAENGIENLHGDCVHGIGRYCEAISVCRGWQKNRYEGLTEMEVVSDTVGW